MIISFISNYWSDILLSLITAGALALCRKLWKELKTYRTILEKEDQERIIKTVSKQLEPIYEIIKKLEKRMDEYDEIHTYLVETLLDSYAYRFNTLCKEYLKRGKITNAQLEQLTEFYKIFTSLEKSNKNIDFYNEDVKIYYDKTLLLPVVGE